MNDHNPRVKLYHLADTKGLIGILQHGIYPQAEILKQPFVKEVHPEYKGETLDELYEKLYWIPSIQARRRLNQRFPMHLESVFLWKEEADFKDSMDIPIPVHADKIPCRCIEANWETASELMDTYEKDFRRHPFDAEKASELQERVHRLEVSYENSMRPLDGKNNPYRTEVMCPCHIPRSAIVPPRTH